MGGGNTAVTDALYLNGLGADVTLLHRRDKLRAETNLQESLFKAGVPVLWDSIVKEITGDKVVSAVKVENLKTGVVSDIPVKGIFVAIGYVPNNETAKMLGLELDEEGYIKTDGKQRTSLPMVYAAGDVTGGVKQIVVAVGEGSVASLTAFEDFSGPYWKKK